MKFWMSIKGAGRDVEERMRAALPEHVEYEHFCSELLMGCTNEDVLEAIWGETKSQAGRLVAEEFPKIVLSYCVLRGSTKEWGLISRDGVEPLDIAELVDKAREEKAYELNCKEEPVSDAKM